MALEEIELTSEQLEWCARPLSSDPVGAAKRLAMEAIIEAVADYRTLVRNEIIWDGQVEVGELAKKEGGKGVWTYYSEFDVFDLIDFLTGRRCAVLIELAGLSVSQSAILRQIAQE